MAIQRFFGASLEWPPMRNMSSFFDTTGAVIDSGSEIFAWIGRVKWADGGTHDIRSVSYLTGTCAQGTGTTTRRTSLQDVDLTAGNPARPDGVVDQSFTSNTMPSSATWTTDTLTTDRVGVAQGTLLAVVFDFTAFGSGAIIRYGGVGAVNGQSTSSLFTASWANVAVGPNVIFTAADGTVGWLDGYASGVGSSTSTEGFANNHASADERGNEFTVDADIEIDGLVCHISPNADTRDWDVVLYENGSAVATVSVDAHSTRGIGTLFYFLPIARRTLSAGSTYRVTVKPTTTGAVTLTVWTFAAAAYRQTFGGLNMAYITALDGTFGTADTTKQAGVGVSICGVEDGAGGGLLTHPGMSGGARG